LDNHRRAPNWVSCEWLGFESLSHDLLCRVNMGRFKCDHPQSKGRTRFESSAFLPNQSVWSFPSQKRPSG
jgi:hypothetical protein